MLTVRLTYDAQQDLISIRKYTIKEWGIKQSQLYITGIRNTILQIRDNPRLGKERPELLEGVSSFPFESHVIYYLIQNEQMIVLGLLHKSMLPTHHLEYRNF